VLLALVPSTFFLVFAVFHRRGTDVRTAILAAMTCLGAYTVLITELLSLPHWLARWPLAVAWALLVGCAGLVLRATPKPAPMVAKIRLTTTDKGFVGAAAVMVVMVALSAIFGAPNTWDSMMYHLPRVVRWLDERSVGFYPTIDYQQLTMPPWHEYAMLQAHALWGGDRFDAMVSFACWLGSAVAVSSIAETMGAQPRMQALAALVCLTLPQGILMASSSKNEWAVSFWLATGTMALLRWAKQPGWFYALLGGTALGLSVFTKGTAYTYLPWIFLAVAVRWDRPAWRKFLVWAPLVLALCLLPNLPLMARNQQLSDHVLGFASPIGDGDAEGRTNFSVPHITLRGTAAGVLRHLSLHLTSPWAGVNQWTQRVVVGAMHAMGADPDDPDAMMQGKSTRITFSFKINALFRHEIYSGSPWHVLLFVVALVGLVRRPRDNGLLLLGAALMLGFVALSAYVRYQPFNARLHLPLLTIGSVLSAAFLGRLPVKLVGVCAAALVLLALPRALSNDLRPLVAGHARPADSYPRRSVFQPPHERSYFADLHDGLSLSWMAAAEAVQATGCHDVGIDSSNLYTYPMFALLGAGVERHVRYLNVTNRTLAYAHRGEDPPCAVVCLYCSDMESKQQTYASVGRPSRFGDVVAWLPPAEPAPREFASGSWRRADEVRR